MCKFSTSHQGGSYLDAEKTCMNKFLHYVKLAYVAVTNYAGKYRFICFIF